MAYIGTIASNTTTGSLSSALTISTNTFYVYGIIVANEAATVVDIDIQNGAGTVTIMEITVPADSTVVMNVPFLADTGLRVAAESSNTKVTVLHSNTLGGA